MSRGKGCPVGSDGQTARPLDDVDRLILAILREDGRISMSALAEQAHISRPNAYARVERLRADGVIQGFTVRLDPARAGLRTSAYVTLKIEQNSWRTLRQRVNALPHVEHIALVSGDFDVLLLVRTRDNDELRQLVLDRLHDMPEVRSTRTLLIFDDAHAPGG
jgi:DNA-binding Lrp family transcriptional regulator